jgi:hypothetical protein
VALPLAAAFRVLTASASRAAGAAALGGGGGRGPSGGGMSDMGDRAAKLTMEFAKLGSVSVALGAAIIKTSSMVLESQRKYARLNSSIAVAFTQLERQRIQRDFGTAAGTAGTTAGLADSINRFERTIQPMKVEISNLANRALSTMTDAITTMVQLSEHIPLLGDRIQKLREQLEKDAQRANEGQWRVLDVLASRGPYGNMQPPMPDLE